MKLQLTFAYLLFSLFLVSCSERKPATVETPKAEENNIAAPELKVSSTFDTIGISKEVFQQMLKEGDHIDIIFNDLPFSMNQDGNSALYQDLQHISSRPLKSLETNCSPFARKIYLSKGEIIMEGDLYYGPECYFQVFIKDGQKLYGNYLTPQGVAYIEQLLKQVEASKPTQ